MGMTTTRKIVTVSDTTKRAIASAAGKLQVTEGQVVDLMIPILQMTISRYGVDETAVAAALEKAELFIASGFASGNSSNGEVSGIDDIKGVTEL